MPEKIDVKRPLSVGEVSARSGVAISTLHFYEREKLIESWRTAGNQRRYARDVLRRIAVIRVAQRAGVPLAEIHDALNALPHGRTPNQSDWARLSTSWRDRLTDRIEALTKLRDGLNDCIGCGCLSVKKCALRNAGDHLGSEDQGAVLF